MLIHKNHFYNLELIEFWACSSPTCILISISNFGCYFQKAAITYNLGQNRWDKIKNLFLTKKKKKISSLINVACKAWGFCQEISACSQSFGLLSTKLGVFWNVWDFFNKTWPDSTLIEGCNWEKMQVEKLSNFSNLVYFHILSQEVLSRSVANFQSKSVDNSVLTSVMVRFYMSREW